MTVDTKICHFYPVKDCWDSVRRVYLQEKIKLLKLFANIAVGIEQYGGTSIPGSLTKGDLDIQIRVGRRDFGKVITLMTTYALPKTSVKTSSSLAGFIKEVGKISVDYIVTVNGSREELYYFAARDLLINDRALLEKYNELKLGFEGKPYKEYRLAKNVFWQKVFAERLNPDREAALTSSTT